MPLYRFNQNDARDHFVLGRIEPGAVAEFDEAPDATWEPVEGDAPVPDQPAPDDPFGDLGLPTVTSEEV